jgi:hypothetical protein
MKVGDEPGAVLRSNSTVRLLEVGENGIEYERKSPTALPPFWRITLPCAGGLATAIDELPAEVGLLSLRLVVPVMRALRVRRHGTGGSPQAHA